MMFLTIKPSEPRVRIDACHFGNDLVSLLACGIAPINTLINICLPETGDFLQNQKTHKPIKHSPHCPQQADRSFWPLSPYFTVRTQGVLSPVSKHVQPGGMGKVPGGNSAQCRCTAVPTAGRYAAAAGQQQGPTLSKEAWSQERGVGGATGHWAGGDGRTLSGPGGLLSKEPLPPKIRPLLSH